jgi:dTDP-4-dehydrorhamnose reductase
MNNSQVPAIPVWGGIECTINRLEDRFFDQLEMNDFYASQTAIEAIASCGIKTFRFPVLWEKHEPSLHGPIDWSWAQSQLEFLKQKNIEPIVGLLHHGSGPRFTHLLDKNFPELFAAYAGKVAAQFPWINLYNPINEPLTTARFSGLYGLWYPHKKNDVSFIRMLLNQLKGISLAMKEIRKVNPNARLVQTEDLAKTYSTKILSYQADFENQRRWLTYDILTGKFDELHPLWKYFMRLGIETKDLHFFLENPCIPNIIGANYYVTSERYLDDKIENYPADKVGGNTVHMYADVEAVRVPLKEPHGLPVLLQELWERYQLPVAITEVHLHCSREEQIRWLKDVHTIATKAKEDGINLVAITAWALLGSFGWNQLLTSFPGAYETGAFDSSAGYLRPTALAHLIKNLNANVTCFDDWINTPGWWKTNNRFLIQPSKKESTILQPLRPIVIIGKTGTLGQAFSKICMQRNLPHILLGRKDIDIANSEQIEIMAARYNPWAIINAAGFVDIDKAESDKDKCYRENSLGPQKLAIICQRLDIKLISFSSDQVFDGENQHPYTESATPNPKNIYGQSKLLTENFIKNVNPSAIVIRTSAFFGPWDQHNFITQAIQAFKAGKTFKASPDILVSPTYIPHLVHASLDLLIDNEKGLWHLANQGQVTWYEWAKMAAKQCGFNTRLVVPDNNNPALALRPQYSVLASEKYSLMPTFKQAMNQYFEKTFPRILWPKSTC